MKKRTILFGSLLAVFLMLVIPNISAFEYTSVKKDMESRMNEIQEKVNIKCSAIQSFIKTIIHKVFNFDLFGLILTLLMLSFMPILSVYQIFETLKTGNLLTSLVWVLNFFIGLKNLMMILNVLFDNSELTENLNLA